ncbi:hypothetical protein COT97_04835 [Candidatus Falkowbacteria bacterium CG10_big_fil_rev_8_21_14_0_10_39_11]|uniref:Uncharacterized protein n=1 Tax=Candidatus Falkowbacteria bacterium CG10_big_fil_rev_8_21_14_0_10_39_11 TaxID=1974565 RepID=A0A2H0V3X4_9BACT|nr:MAG: hypothetical protein COT97_04835 [Candidatus Falkowbacteria bacterium CG10_big_fil_rev_8_21_14_0_10_39_11]
MPRETFLFLQAKQKLCAVERWSVCLKPSFLVGTMIDNKKSTSMTWTVRKIVSDISIDDLTLDNGIENKNHEQFGIKTYFAAPHSPWQKPHVKRK